MKKENLENGIEKLDIKLLERLIKETTSVKDRMGGFAVYFIPLKEEYIDVCQYILAKHGVNMEKYKSSLNEFPILKISFKEIDKLSQTAKDFLFSINVNPGELQKHLGKIIMEMKNR